MASSTELPRQGPFSLPEHWDMDAPAEPVTRRLAEAHAMLADQPLAAARVAEEVFNQVRERRDLSPWLALVTMIDGRVRTLSDFHPLDPLIDFYDQRRTELGEPEAVLDEIDCTVFAALVVRQPDHPELPRLAERSLEIFQQETNANTFARLKAANYLMLHRIWCGDLVGADTLRVRMAALHERTPDVHSRLMCYSMASMIQRLYLRYEQCRCEIETGLALAREFGVHVWDSQFYMQGAMLALSRENPDEARSWLEPMAGLAPPEHYMDRAGYHYCLAWLHSVDGDTPLAIRHAEEAATLAERSGAIFPQTVTHVGLGQIYLEQRRIRPGLYHFIQARRTGRRMNSEQPVKFMRGLLTAHLAYSTGFHRRGERALRQALAIGRHQHYLNFPWWRGDIIARLCARALEADIEQDYVHTLIRARRLKPPQDERVPENWYWPLKVEVLGVPRVLLDGGEPGLSRQLFNLLLALACLADREGWVSRDRLVDELWPDSEGDQGHKALDTNIHRLRKQLGMESLVRVRSGRVGLDAGLCRVDFWQLRRALDQGEPGAEEVEDLLEIMERLEYGAGSRWLPPADTLQRRIATRMLALVRGSLRDQESVPRWLETLLAYLPASEYVWQELIRHYLRQGLYADALDAWRRCRDALVHHQGVEPSPGTETLLEALPVQQVVRR